MNQVFVTVALTWAVGASLLLILLVRQVSLISVRLNLQMTMPDASDVGVGPELGTQAPASVSAMIANAGLGADATLVALTGTCESCHLFAESLPSRTPGYGQHFIVLLPGMGKPLEDLRDKLPHWVRMVSDPVASEIGSDLGLARTRRALRIMENRVVGSAEVADATELGYLIDAEVPIDIHQAEPA